MRFIRYEELSPGNIDGIWETEDNDRIRKPVEREYELVW